MSDVNYQVAKATTLNKIRFLHFNMLKPYVEEIANPYTVTLKARPTPSRSVGFFDDPGVQNENADFETSADGNQEFRPLQLLGVPTTPPTRRGLDAAPGQPGVNGIAHQEANVVKIYNAAELEIRREDEPVSPPATPREPAATPAPEGELEIAYEVRPTLARGPPKRFGIDDFVWRYRHLVSSVNFF